MRRGGCGAPFVTAASMRRGSGRLRPRVGLESAPEPLSQHREPDLLLNDRLRALVAELPENARTVVLLRYQEDLDPTEIAGMLDMPVSTVKSLLHRSLAVLRRTFAETGGVPVKLEDDLRAALRREPPPSDFAAPVMARTRVVPFLRRPIAMAIAAAVALAAVIPSVYEYRREQRGIEARDQLVQALSITKVQLQQAREKIRRNARHKQQ